MKIRKILSLALIGSLLFVATISCSKDKDELPQEIKTYISTHFPKNEIVSYVQPANNNRVAYLVTLTQNIEIGFNKEYKMLKVESDDFELPKEIIPESIFNYVQENYPLAFITDIEIEDDGYEVELNNGLELIFNQNGEFVKIDNDDVLITIDDLPAEIKDYISLHFPSYNYVKIVKDVEDNEFDVTIMANGGNFETTVKLNFDIKTNNVVEIEGYKKLPDSVIPVKILDYVNANYPENFIISWELETNSQEVTLDNNIELVFNLEGDFLHIDND